MRHHFKLDLLHSLPDSLKGNVLLLHCEARMAGQLSQSQCGKSFSPVLCEFVVLKLLLLCFPRKQILSDGSGLVFSYEYSGL